MPSVTETLIREGKLRDAPSFMVSNIHYETLMGSTAYGTATTDSDQDVYGWVMPPINMIFPHLDGEIEGFGRQKKRFNQFQKQMEDGYDLSIYSIVRYFHLVMENNPNMLDSLFTPNDCVLHITRIGDKVRANRKLFLHKGYYHKARGFAFSQMNRMKRDATGKRKDLIDTYGYDVKSATHVVRLLLQAREILESGTLTLDANKDTLSEIRRGEWFEVQVREFFNDMENDLNFLYENSNLRHSPDEDEIKNLLVECIEMHYGSLVDIVPRDPSGYRMALIRARDIILGALDG